MSERSPGIDATMIAGTAGLKGRHLWTLLAGNALTAIGIGFFLPILPLVVAARGGNSLFVGVIFASGMVGRALATYPAGRLSDRFGRRAVIVLSLLVYALLFPLYALPIAPLAIVSVRFVQALAGGAYEPAAMALVADLSRAEHRSRAFGRMRASDMAGLVVGPALGGLVAGVRLELVFLAASGTCLAATVLMWRLPRDGATAAGPERPVRTEPRVPALEILRRLLPVALLGMAIMWVFGTFDSVWTLYLTSRGATTFQVGLSFATYALPVVMFAGLAGGLADRFGRVRAGTLSVLAYGLIAWTYPFVASVAALIGIGLVEGALTAAGTPALAAEVSSLAPPGAQGRTQGVYGTALLAAQVMGAVAGGALYLLGPAPPFLAASAVCLLGVAASVALRSRRRSLQP